MTHYMVRSAYKVGALKYPEPENYDIQQPGDPGGAMYRNLYCISLNSFSWLFFMMEMQYIYFEAGPEFLHTI